MLGKTEKIVNIKRGSRSFVSVVREHYLRNDIPCKSALCASNCKQPKGFPLLPKDLKYYIIPDCQNARKYLEIYQLKEIVGVIFLQTVLNHVQQKAGKQSYKQIMDMCKDPTKSCVVFNNEFHEACYIKRNHGSNAEDWKTRITYASAKWYYQHLNEKVPIIIITEDSDAIAKYGNKTNQVFVMTIKDYIEGFWPNLQEAKDLEESLSALDEINLNIGATICKGFQEYYPLPVLEAGIKSGRFLASYIRVNKHRPTHEAFIQKRDTKLSLNLKDADILIPGAAYRNRAVDGDFVVVEILPQKQWQSKCSTINQNNADSAANDEASEVMITGRVVGVLQRNTRDYVVAIPEEEAKSRSSRILTIPWDCRIPKIRISTRQHDKLRNERFIVRIDSWEITSLYPNGHFVKSLGAAGNIETEIASILVEYSLSVPSFSERIMNEMPKNSRESPWKMEPTEVQRRRDLRTSHLIFSIDPKGCEDVDDTLSIKSLPNGHWELGVHIADVSYFVKPNSFTDLEARSKTTTIYLADRRYDMLPAVLSSDLCSLISEQDRYAVSVMWELDEKCEVLNTWYGRTIIKSKYKLFYEAAQQIADGDMGLDSAIENIPELKNVTDSKQRLKSFEEMKAAIRNLMHVARQIKSKRAENGAIDLESAEIQIQINEGKDIKELTPKKSLEVHETIAECMIFANHWVAKRIKEKFGNNSILRNHPPPKQDFFTNIMNCALAKGYRINTSTNHALAKSLDGCVDSDPNVNKIFRMLSTQAMMVASYFSTGSVSEEDFAHYGLALNCYTHFTSPIRRYADVLVHRLLLASIDDPLVDKELLLNNKELQEICQHINIKHRDADHAQKESVKFFQAMYFKDHSNDDDICLVDATVYSLRSNGVLVFIPKFGLKGAVFLKDKNGNVVHPCGDNIQYSSGSIDKHTTKLVVKYNGTQSYDIPLFIYLKVRIIVVSSTMHADRLQFELVSLATNQSKHSNVANIKRADLVHDVKSKETEKTTNLSTTNSQDDELTKLKVRYGQTHKSVSLYEMFRTFQLDSLQTKKKKRVRKN